MVATKHNIEVHAKRFRKNPKDYTLLDTAHLKHFERDNFHYSLEILNVIRASHRVNETIEALGIKDSICITDLTIALKYVLLDVPFSKNTIHDWFKAMHKLEKFNGALSNLSEIEYYIPVDLELKMFGLTSLELKYVEDKGDETYHKFYGLFVDNELSLDEFIDQTQKYVSRIKQECAA